MPHFWSGLRQAVVLGTTLLAMGWAAAGSAAVGRTDVQPGVDAGGGARLTIPIRMTEGIAGMTPRLAIGHSGSGTNSILGVGFGLAGLSVIAPCRRTLAQDGLAAPVRLAAGDRYCLDGARLRGVSGTYGEASAQYRTEVDQLARVTSLASVDGVPGWFRVETREGLTLEYGNTADSRLLANTPSGQKPMFWALNKVSDRSGNAITYHYDTDQTQRRFRPSHILYTASNAGAARYRVQFVYQGADRPDPQLDVTPSELEAARGSTLDCCSGSSCSTTARPTANTSSPSRPARARTAGSTRCRNARSSAAPTTACPRRHSTGSPPLQASGVRSRPAPRRASRCRSI